MLGGGSSTNDLLVPYASDDLCEWFFRQMDKTWLFHHVDRLSLKLSGVLIAGVFALQVSLGYPVTLLFGSASYETMGMPIAGSLYRGLVYLGATALSYLFFTLVPKNEVTYSKIGQKTLYVYLLHGLFIQLIRRLNVLQIEGVVTLLLALVASGVIVLLLSSRFVTLPFKPVIELKRIKQQEVRQFMGSSLTSK